MRLTEEQVRERMVDFLMREEFRAKAADLMRDVEYPEVQHRHVVMRAQRKLRAAGVRWTGEHYEEVVDD